MSHLWASFLSNRGDPANHGDISGLNPIVEVESSVVVLVCGHRMLRSPIVHCGIVQVDFLIAMRPRVQFSLVAPPIKPDADQRQNATSERVYFSEVSAGYVDSSSRTVCKRRF